MTDDTSPLLRAKAYDQPSVFQPANLLREGRRQRGRPDIAVPAVCLLDPDGDIVRHLTATGQATEHPGWACYHTTLWTFDLDGTEVGVDRLRRRRIVRRAARRAARRVGLRAAHQRHLVRVDHPGRRPAVLRDHRPGAARRGHQPPLPPARHVVRRARPTSWPASTGSSTGSPSRS